MNWMIRGNVGMMPGGIIYEDPRTPEAKWLDDHTFLEERVSQVIGFRRANLKIYPEPLWTDPNFVRAQISLFNCQRLGFDPQYCQQVGPPAPPSAPPAGRVCDVDGTPLAVQYCETCGGNKVNGYKCPKCGKAFPP